MKELETETTPVHEDGIEDILLGYFTGEASETERKRVETWAESSPENRHILEQAWFVWQCSEKLRVMRNADPVSALRRFKTRLRHWHRNRVLRRAATLAQLAAAILLLPALVGAIHFWNINRTETTQWAEVKTSPGVISEFELPDGSTVWLNSVSSIRYPLRFKRGRREVELQGEGYFSVRKDTKAPFFIKVDDEYSVEVLGTEFNVTAYADDEVIETTLVDGSVRLNIAKEHGRFAYRTLRPNQRAVFNRVSNSLEVVNVNPEYDIAWKDGVMVFRNEPMGQVLKVLSRHYNVRFNIGSPKVLEGEVTARFRNETLAQVLEYLSLASNTEFSINTPNRIKGDSLRVSQVDVTKR